MNRLSAYDPTGEVDLEDPQAVEDAILAIFDRLYGRQYDAALLSGAIHHLVRAYRGEYPGLLRCDTLYHDLRHGLETGLTMTRMLDGDARSGAEPWPANVAVAGVLLALFHDIGLLRRDSEARFWGPSLTPVHEERGVEFMRDYLPGTSLAAFSAKAELIMATKLVFKLPANWPAADRKLASMIASADLLSQLADRCYLEKCRDFLFVEFSAFGLAGRPDSPYPDRETLLLKSPGFVESMIHERLEQEFGGVYRLLELHCGGRNPWREAIARHLEFLAAILQAHDFGRLKRHPKPFTGIVETDESSVAAYIAHASALGSRLSTLDSRHS